MRKALLLVMLLTLALAAGKAMASAKAGGHGGGEAAAAAEGGEHKDAKKDDKKKPAVHKITQSESYMMIDPFYTSIVEGQRPQGLLMVGIGLDVPDKTLRERIDREMPRLRDAYVRALMSFAAVSARSWRQPNVSDLADRLQTVTDRYLARKGAKVLLAQVMIRLNN